MSVAQLASYQTGPLALSIRPDLKYTRLMETNTTMISTKTITLELTPYEQECLLSALNTEAGKWLSVKTEVLLGERINASYEGADMLYKEAKGLRERVALQVSQF